MASYGRIEPRSSSNWRESVARLSALRLSVDGVVGTPSIIRALLRGTYEEEPHRRGRGRGLGRDAPVAVVARPLDPGGDGARVRSLGRVAQQHPRGSERVRLRLRA